VGLRKSAGAWKGERAQGYGYGFSGNELADSMGKTANFTVKKWL
jgi:hypothetical protein